MAVIPTCTVPRESLGRYGGSRTLPMVTAMARVLVVDVAPAVAEGLRGTFDVVAAPTLEAVDLRGSHAPIAVLVGWPVPHVGLAELGAPVLAVIDDGANAARADLAIADAMQRGAHDIVLASASASELVARVQAAARTGALRRQLTELSRIDPLTGLANRRHLDEHLEMTASMAKRQRSLFSLLMVDIDRTRRVNDAFGHKAGDAVVAEVANRILAGLRGEDVAGRWGGEEFVVLLPHTELDGAWRLADRIRGSICAVPVELDEGRDVMVTASIGCAEGNGSDLADQLRRAQAALDEAKAAGRNKVVADVSAVAP